MKKLLSTLLSIILLILLSTLVYAEDDDDDKLVSICPKTLSEDSCMDCHSIPDWSLIEKLPDANRNLPFGPEMVIKDNVAHIFITGISSIAVDRFFEYIRWHPEIEKCVFEIHSPGGSLFEAWRIVGLMDLWKSKGMLIETRCHGFAASAGFVLFVNGTPGHRFASATAELMWHELYTFEFFKVNRPSDAEDEAVVLRHLQSTASNYLADRSNLTSEEWDLKVFKKEFWCNGAEAVEFGLSDGLPGKKITETIFTQK